MKENLERAINGLAEKINAGVSSGEALHYSQAALNLAHVLLSIRSQPENPDAKDH